MKTCTDGSCRFSANCYPVSVSTNFVCVIINELDRHLLIHEPIVTSIFGALHMHKAKNTQSLLSTDKSSENFSFTKLICLNVSKICILMPVLYCNIDDIVLDNEIISIVPLAGSSSKVSTMNPNVNWQVFSIVRLFIV